MALFDFKNYGTEGETPVQDSDIVFHETHDYADPSNSDETRRQLSTPLFQLKKFINSLFDANGKMIPSNLPAASESTAGTMSATDKTKLNGIESGAEANVIETVKINGTALTPSDKAVNIPNATNSSSGLMTSDEKIKLATIEQGAQVNVIETISLNGEEIVPSEKAVEISIPNATVLTDGLMSSTDKKLLNSASSSVSIGSNLVKRDNMGRFRASAPSNSADVANKQYVDAHVLPDPTTMPAGAVMQVKYDAEVGANIWTYTVLPIPGSGLGEGGLGIISTPQGGWTLDDPWNDIIYHAGTGEGETQ